MANRKPKLIIITGPTGAGKSDLALASALILNGEIINADSLALYRGFDIGTAKSSKEDQRLVRHHLIDVLNPDEDFDAAAYMKTARPLVEQLNSENKAALVVGGTGFYLRSLTAGLFEGPGRDAAFRADLAAKISAGLDPHELLKKQDPETAARLHPNDRMRIERALEVKYLTGQSISAQQRRHGLQEAPFKTLVIIIDRPIEEMRERIDYRTRKMFKNGLLDEVNNLLQAGWSQNLKPFGSIGYKEVLAHLRGELSLEEALVKIAQATGQFAKRQRTWFRGQMPQGQWFHPKEAIEIINQIQKFLDIS